MDYEELLMHLNGMDKTEIDDAHGWWETSTGAEYGADVKKSILEYIAQLQAENKRLREAIQEMIDEYYNPDNYLEAIDLVMMAQDALAEAKGSEVMAIDDNVPIERCATIQDWQMECVRLQDKVAQLQAENAQLSSKAEMWEQRYLIVGAEFMDVKDENAQLQAQVAQLDAENKDLQETVEIHEMNFITLLEKSTKQASGFRKEIKQLREALEALLEVKLYDVKFQRNPTVTLRKVQQLAKAALAEGERK